MQNTGPLDSKTNVSRSPLFWHQKQAWNFPTLWDAVIRNNKDNKANMPNEMLLVIFFEETGFCNIEQAGPHGPAVGFGQIEVAGIPLRYLERPKSLPLIGGQTLMARRDWLDANRTVATGFARSVAKASIYLTANPVAGAKAFLEMYPEVAPRGMAQADAIKQVVTAIGRRITLYQPPYANTKMGATNPDELKLEAEFVGLKIDDVAPLFTNTLIDDINTFDADAIRAAARAVKN